MKIDLYPPLFIYEVGQRKNQEDEISQWDNRLFVLCDGMGGHECGEIASQTVCQSLSKWFQDNITDDTFTDNQLYDALNNAYAELDKRDESGPRKMGTTLTIIYIHDKGVTAAHIGDSRIYHIRPNVGILYQSRDHSLVYDLFQAGEITYEEMSTHPQKNIIARAMSPGSENRSCPDIIHITDIQPGDYFYMCSDGMLEQMSNDKLFTIFSADASGEEIRQQLILETSNNQDNHSAWILHVKEIIAGQRDNIYIIEESGACRKAISILSEEKNKKHEGDVNEVELHRDRPLLRKMKMITDYILKRNKLKN